MSSLVMTLSIVGGIALLIIIAYLNQMAENNRRRKARLKADIAERYRHLADLSEQFAGQLMTPQLKLLLSGWQLHFVKQLLEVDRHDQTYRAVATELRSLLDQGTDIAIRNTSYPVKSDNDAKQIRGQLELLHGQVTRGAHVGLLPDADAKRWIQEIRHMLAQVYIELYENQAKRALHDKQPNLARLALERGIQFVQKQADAQRYQVTLAHFQKQLARINALLFNGEESEVDDGSNELTEGLKTMEDEDWRKKALYD